MRLWHYKLIPVLPKKQLVSQWRECIAIKRRWEQEKPDSPLVIYVRNYDRCYFLTYVIRIGNEMAKRNINFQRKYFDEIAEFCFNHRTNTDGKMGLYPEHNDRYLKQCLYNLQEKYDRKIITDEEWDKIKEEFNFDNN